MSDTTQVRPGTRTSRRSSGESNERLRTQNARLLTIVLLIVCLTLLGAALGGVFTVRSVDVVGQNLPAGAIQQAAGVTGQNIFTVNTDTVINRLSAVPSIQVDRVESAFPDRVIVYARARLPVLAWQSPTGIVLLDAGGTQLGQVAHSALPMIVGGRRPPSVGVIAGTRYAVTLLPSAPNGALTGLSYDPRTGLNIVGKAGWKAVLGDGDAQTMVARVATLGALLHEALRRGQQITFVDLRFRQPYYRVAGG